MVVTTSYPAHEGDPSGHFVQSEVAELRREGHEVTVVRPRAGGAFGWPGAAARIRERPSRLLEAGAWTAEAAVRVRAARPERVIAHWSVPCGFPVADAALAFSEGVELELVSHGGDIRLLRALPDTLRLRLVERLVARATRWRFVSAALQAELDQELPARLADAIGGIARVEPSPLGSIDSVRERARARRRGLGGRHLYVCAGRLVPAKRVDKVIDYVASSVHSVAPILVVLGDGPERARLEEVAVRWRLDARFLGTTPRDEALAWIGAADEVVHASAAEGLSTVVREAERLGVRVTILS